MIQDDPQNIDRDEQERFDAVASGWWDPAGPFRPLHELNPARLKYVADKASLDGARVVDVGCGGGILSESLARKGASVTGIDVAPRVLAVARLHLHESGLDVDYREMTVEDLAREAPQTFDVVTCMEMLEHVPDPRGFLSAVGKLLTPEGLIVVQCPNLESWMARLAGDRWFWLAPPDHLYHFSPGPLRELLDETGFRIYRGASSDSVNTLLATRPANSTSRRSDWRRLPGPGSCSTRRSPRWAWRRSASLSR